MSTYGTLYWNRWKTCQDDNLKTVLKAVEDYTDIDERVHEPALTRVFCDAGICLGCGHTALGSPFQLCAQAEIMLS